MTILDLNTQLKINNFFLEINCSIDFSKGIVGVYGPSGSGKTLFLRVVAGLEKNNKGKIIFDKHIWQDHSNKIFIKPSKRHTTLVFQDNRLFSNLNVKDNILFGYRRNKNIINLSYDDVLDVLQLKNLLNRRILDLSGGEKQRVAIARSLLTEKNILLLDEAFSSQDTIRKKELIIFLKKIYLETRIPILFVTHSIEDLVNIANKTILFDSGKIVSFDDTKNIISKFGIKSNNLESEPSNLIDAIVDNHNKEFGLTNIIFDKYKLTIPLIDKPNGSEVVVKILSKDIIISNARPNKISIRNILIAKIYEISPVNKTFSDIYFILGRHKINSRITSLSLNDLGLKIGDKVFLLIKSTMIQNID